MRLVKPRIVVTRHYITILKQLLEHIRRKCQELVNNCILHQDNAPPCKYTALQTSRRTQHQRWNIPLLSRPCTVQLLIVPCPKESLKRTQFCFGREPLTATQTFFNHLPEYQFCKTFEGKWPERMQKCIFGGGRYFEKNWRKLKMLVAIENKI